MSQLGGTWTKKRRSRDESYAKDALAYGSLVQADHDAAQDVVPLVGTGQQRHRVIQGFIQGFASSLFLNWVSDKAQVSEGGAVVIGGVAAKAAEHNTFDAARRCGDFRGNGASAMRAARSAGKR